MFIRGGGFWSPFVGGVSHRKNKKEAAHVDAYGDSLVSRESRRAGIEDPVAHDCKIKEGRKEG